jgi:hypothetical protein
VELKLRPTGDAAAEISEISEHCEKICRAAAKKKRGGLTEALIGLEREKLTRDELQTLLEETRGVFLAALTARYGQKIPEKYGKTVPELAKTLTKMQIMRTIEILQKYRQECLYNVSPGQVLGALAVELEGIL